MSSTPMDLDSPRPPKPITSAVNGLAGIGRVNGISSTAKVSEVIGTFRPTKLFRREDGDKPTSILSLDFDDPGELLMTSESDESIQIYSVKDGKHQKTLLSKKYGVKLAKFTHQSSCIVYASTKENDTIRYLSTHDNTFIRYFVGHEKSVTCIAMNPGADSFLSCSEDNTVRVWDTNSPNCCGKLMLHHPYLAAWDPSANVIAIASESAQTILLYDFRNYDKEPFATFDLLEHSHSLAPYSVVKNWNKLEFSNDGKSLLVGTSGHGHMLLDAFEGQLKSYLKREKGGPKRLAAGNHSKDDASEKLVETSGDACFSPDGRYVLSGMRRENILVWDTLQLSPNKLLNPIHELEMKAEAGVLAFNPRFNFFASADKEVVFWVPDPHAKD